MTLKKCDATVLMNTASDVITYCVFEHYAVLDPSKPPELIYVGTGKLATVLMHTDARKNTEWQRLFAAGGTLMVRIIATSENARDCQIYAVQHMKQMARMPRCNLHGSARRGLKRAVQCSDGRVFSSQKEAALQCGITESVLSRHMNNMVPHVNGLRFTYVPES